MVSPASKAFKKGELTRQRIIEMSAPVFNTKGFAGCSLAELLNATGLQKGGIYRHFESKEALALESFDYAWKQTKKARLDCLTSPTPKMQLIEFISNFAKPAEIVGGGCPLLNTAVEFDDQGNTALRQKAVEAMEEWLSFLQELLREGIEQNEFSTNLNLRATAMCIISTIEGAVIMSGLLETQEPLTHVCSFLENWLQTL
jgi:TetR/AcrR family transcriptional regulator, transcriptional repressor for nem operon